MTRANRSTGTDAAQSPPPATSAAPASADREIVATRVFDAPRALVFKAWTDPAHIGQWWGPRGFTTTTYAMDAKPGGVWRFCMHGPDGVDYENRFTFLEIVEPGRIVYKHGGGKESDPDHFQGTVTFEDQGGKTRLTMRMLFPTAAARDAAVEKYGAVEGLDQTLDRLGEYAANLAGQGRPGLTVTLPTDTDREIVVTRGFDAPRRLVFEAWTSPEHLPRWLLGPGGWTMPVCEVDLRPGGAWHFVWRGPEGAEMAMRGVYREIVPPDRIVSADSWGGDWPETLNTLTLDEEGGKTTVTQRVLYPSKEARDAALGTGMTGGMSESFHRLDAYLRSMA